MESGRQELDIWCAQSLGLAVTSHEGFSVALVRFGRKFKVSSAAVTSGASESGGDGDFEAAVSAERLKIHRGEKREIHGLHFR